MRLILASASPRRRELIKKIDKLEVEIVPSNVDERSAATDPVAYAKELAYIKATDVFRKTGGLVLGADTVVEVDGTVLGKPKTAIEAEEMLKKLCGKTHRVITGICLACQENVTTYAEISYVTFKEYDSKLVASYIASGSPFDKAGGYGIQDDMIKAMTERVEGDLDNIIGLPVKKVENLLKQYRR
ncbi:MAG: septum formation protein Maf [Clostridiales bacterium]|nr:septum formation protein Maf [Clostridiales bacterium]